MKEIKAIFILAGHSKYNPGANYKGLDERTIVKQISNKVYNDIKKIKGDIELYSIGINEDVSLEDKVKKVNELCNLSGYNIENSILLEIHINAGKGTGIEVLGYMDYNPFRQLAFILIDHLVKQSGLKDRGIKDGKPFMIINSTKPLAVIVECGFIDNDIDRKLLSNEQGINKFSTGIINGLSEYLGLDKPQPDLTELYKELVKENEDLININISLKKENNELKDRLIKIDNIIHNK